MFQFGFGCCWSVMMDNVSRNSIVVVDADQVLTIKGWLYVYDVRRWFWLKYRRKGSDGLVHKGGRSRGSWSIALGVSWPIVLWPSGWSWMIVLGSFWGPLLRIWPSGRGKARRLPWTPWWSSSSITYCLGSSGRCSSTSPAKTVEDIREQITPHSNLRGLGE